MKFEIIGDWGTSNLRLYLLKNGELFDTKFGPGVTQAQSDLLSELLFLTASWRENYAINAIYLAGMVGSKLGIKFTPYLKCPTIASEWNDQLTEITNDLIPIYIASGLECINFNNAPDIMRGEEAQIFGVINNNNFPDNASIILPGTHSKWALINTKKIMNFQTVPTGELFNLMNHFSTFGFKISAIEANESLEGFEDGLSRSQYNNGFLSNIFEARSSVIIYGKSHIWNRNFISGLLIGSEINLIINNIEFKKYNELPIYIIGENSLSALYKLALKFYNVEAKTIDATEATINGLKLLIK